MAIRILIHLVISSMTINGEPVNKPAASMIIMPANNLLTV